MISIFTVINLVLPALVERTRGTVCRCRSAAHSCSAWSISFSCRVLLIGLLACPRAGRRPGRILHLPHRVGRPAPAALLLLGLTAAVSCSAPAWPSPYRDGFQPAWRRPAGVGLLDALPGMVRLHAPGDDDGSLGPLSRRYGSPGKLSQRTDAAGLDACMTSFDCPGIVAPSTFRPT